MVRNKINSQIYLSQRKKVEIPLRENYNNYKIHQVGAYFRYDYLANQNSKFIDKILFCGYIGRLNLYIYVYICIYNVD